MNTEVAAPGQSQNTITVPKYNQLTMLGQVKHKLVAMPDFEHWDRL